MAVCCTPKPAGWVWQIWVRRVLEAGRKDWTVWPCLLRCPWKLSSSRPEGQERLNRAEATGLSGSFRSTHLRGRWWGNGQPWAPQTVVGAGWAGALPLMVCSFLGKERSLDKEEEGGVRGVPRPPRHKLPEGSRLWFGRPKLLHHRADCLPKQLSLRDESIKEKNVLLLLNLLEIRP